MTNKDFIEFLKSKIKDTEVNYFNTFSDLSKDKSITVYQRTGTAPINLDDLRVLPVTIIVIYTNSANKAQEFSNDIFYKYLFRKEKQTINGIEFIMQAKSIPVFIGKNDNGCYEYAIDLNIFY